MELSLIILKQIILMFIYMMIGFLLCKKKFVTEQGSKELGKILLYVILPVVIVKAYLVTFSVELLKGLVLSFMASLLALLLSMILSRVVFGSRYPIEQFSSAFSNAGFIGIPLVEMTFNDSMAVFYVSSFVALLNILQWTYGIVVMTGKKDSIALKKITTNPIIISFLLGILLFFLPVELPEVLDSAVAAITSMNAPVAMIILGIYLAQMKLRDLFTDRAVYLCALMRLIVIPLATAAVLALIPGNEMLKMSVLIVAATPVGSNVAIFAQMEGLDHTQAVKDICLSTVLCIVTIPVVVTAAGVIL
ncbi:MAG TPA: AEC family transporter [Candidatus Mediterraneibacter intestinavium]|nr:AEC family transporter [Candidatus Mediterraneibacter intestinavium]